MKRALLKAIRWIRKHLVFGIAGFSIVESALQSFIMVSSAIYLFNAGSIGLGMAIIGLAIFQLAAPIYLSYKATQTRKANLTLVAC